VLENLDFLLSLSCMLRRNMQYIWTLMLWSCGPAIIQWLRHYAISWKVAGSRPGLLNQFFFNLRNEYRKQNNRLMFPGVERGRCVKLTKLLPSASGLFRQCGILHISQPYKPPRPVTGIALLYGDGVCFLWGTNWTVTTATSSQYLAVNCEPIV
jgi:hypothetical protein